MPPKRKSTSSDLYVSAPSQRLKRLKRKEDAGTVVVKLGLKGLPGPKPNPIIGHRTSTHRSIPVIVAKDGEQHVQPEAVGSESSPDLDFTQPLEPEGYYDELWAALSTQEDAILPAEFIDDEVVDLFAAGMLVCG